MNNHIETKKSTIKARISEIQRERYTVQCEYGECKAVLKGSFYRDAEEYPVIGDYVNLIYNPSGDSLIESLQPRKSVFIRAERSGHAEGYVKNLKGQCMAANFDYVFIVVSLNQNYNLSRIARYVSVTIQGGAKPVVVLTKADLCPNPDTYYWEVKSLSELVQVHVVSSLTGEGLDELKEYMGADTTIILLGSSGVGKSTLLNTIAGCDIMKTGKIREEDGRGRHTTTHRELFRLPSGVTIIDTPGIRELGIFDMEEGIEETFTDILELAAGCRFGNCGHGTEPGCAVQAAIKSGTLSKKRWDMYRKLQAESEWSKKKASYGKKKICGAMYQQKDSGAGKNR